MKRLSGQHEEANNAAPHGSEAYDLGEPQARSQGLAQSELKKLQDARDKREAWLKQLLPTWLIEDRSQPPRKRFYVELAWYQWVPAVNLVYDFLFDRAPDVDRVKDILSTFGLVNALLLAVVMAIPGSVSYDELTAANIRFGLGSNVRPESYVDFNTTTVNSAYVGFVKLGPNRDWFAALINSGPSLYDQFGSDDNFGYSNRLAFYIAGAVGALTCALLSVVLCFFFMAASDFHHSSSFDAWWYYARWLVAQQFISTAWGVVLTYFTLMMLMEIKFPDYCDIRKSLSPSNAQYFAARGVSRLQPQCPRNYFFWSTIIVLWVTIAVCLVIMSLASMSRYYHEATDKVAGDAVNETHQLKRSLSNEAASRRRDTTVDANMLKVLASLQETVEALSRQLENSSGTATRGAAAAATGVGAWATF